MDRIISSFMDDFCEEFNYKNLEQSKLFEHFVNYIIVSKIYPDRHSLDKMNVGGTRNPGIDGLAIMVNGHLVTSHEEIDYFIEDDELLSVEFVFVQAKTSDSFDLGGISSFIASVKEFFRDGNLDFEDELLNLRDAKNYIYKKSIKLEKSPNLKLYYATTGKWTGDVNLQTIIDSGIRDLRTMDLFTNIKFIPYDSDKLKSAYREIKNKITKEIAFEKHTILPKMENVKESYLGIIPAKELIEAISDDDGEIIKSIFYDNVRDFQGFNKVNSGIKNSIENAKDKFVLLNNGITIVAKVLNKIGSSFKISDFQIVNGCQSSHVLHSLKTYVNDEVFIALKLIVTDKEDVINDIIKATNSQTEVKNEAFEILKPFHKKLEEFYLTFGKEKSKRVYYERRSRQFADSKNKNERVIGLSTQIASFVAMFLNEPQSTHRYFGELLKAYSNKLFTEEQSHFPYYISGLAICVVEDLYKTGELKYTSKKFKYHLLLMFRIFVAGEKFNIRNHKEMEKYCQKLAIILWDSDKSKEIFKQLEGKLIKSFEDTHLLKRQAHSMRAFTEELLKSVVNVTILSNKKTGTLTYYNVFRGFGFIKTDVENEDIFVHFSELEKVVKTSEIVEGLKLSFDIFESNKGPQAKNLEKR